MQQLRLAASSTKYDTIALNGGLDLLTPSLQLKPGYVRDALNWEQSINGGYTRIGGYERVDGRVSPSSATYQTITVNITGGIGPGQIITGGTSGTTGTVLSVTNAGVVAFSKSSGVFTLGESVLVAAVPQGTITALSGLGPDADYNVTQLALAANLYRADIQAVPGSGPVRGVALLAGALYAWRDNVGATAMNIYRATPAGWVIVQLRFELAFSAGSSEYAIGETITQGGVSAFVRGVSLESGSWGASTAAGHLTISAPTGGNFAAGAAAGGGVATLAGVEVAITLLPGGRVRTDIGNFNGTPKLYGCDGVNLGFEFDGATLTRIRTGNVPDVPTTVCYHKDHLWFAFGTNMQNSGITTPFNWTAIAGGVGYRLNDTITELIRQPGDQSAGALAVLTLSTTDVIYGKSAADFQKVPFEESAGARKYSGQRLGGQAVVFADLGAFALSTSQVFGNFEPSTLTMKIRPFTQVRRTKVSGSITNREKSQYRIFFSDGYGLYLTIINGRAIGQMPVNFPNPVTCNCVGDISDGKESSFFGSTNGFVYRLDAGSSFDGAPITSYWTLTYANQGNSRIFKAWRGASFEVQGDSYATFSMTYDMGYGSADRPQGVTPALLPINLQAVFWDEFVWDEFTWDGRTLGPSETEMKGTGENIAVRIDCTSDKFLSFTINSLILHYFVRKAIKK